MGNPSWGKIRGKPLAAIKEVPISCYHLLSCSISWIIGYLFVETYFEIVSE